MGGKYSTLKDNRAPIVAATKPPTSLPNAYNIPPTRWSSNSLPESQAPPAMAVPASAPACSAFAPGKCNPSVNTTNKAYSFPTTRTTSNIGSGGGGGGSGGGSGGSFPLKAAVNKEVVVFHSSTKWREYFEGSKQSNKLVVIYFTATWCGPCRYMEPTIKELASKYMEIDIVKLDVDELFNVSREFGVQTMPTFLFMKKGVQIDKVIGARKEDLQTKVEKHFRA